MGILTIERLGGFGGFGLPGSRIRSRGRYPFANLSSADQAKVEDLFKSGGQSARGAPPVADAFHYRITRDTPNGPQTVEVPESAVPAELQSSVKDELQ
jgi:hypothetical protein